MTESKKNIYIIASELDHKQKQNNIIIHCSVPCNMTMHTVYQNLKKAATDFCKKEDSYGKEILLRHNLIFNWQDFAEYVRNKHTMPYGIEIINIIESAPSINLHENLVDAEAVFTEGLP